ncbi:hypothetical protein RM549_15775 [Salegentibacter sp. F188]|uniref:Restriction endonuclease type IV Mrr domain-containing protein n=1 Tax=Autumnicola patrickiae TaxID=3075591 RepID=A0ABU3E5Q3_9FLAO|nr:hypothetical protein [Salegentibacter sp. F188]MDT0691255.1 hypothetical protein [Salegentibacter sp. F188]
MKVQDKYNSLLNEKLKKTLFDTSSNLCQALSEKFDISTQNARQVIKRAVATKAIKSSAPYTFGKNQYIYIYNKHELLIDNIKEICKISRPPIYRLLDLIDLNNGIVSYYEGLKITSSPVEESTTKVSTLQDILNLLFKLNILYTKRDQNDVVYIIYKVEGKELNSVEEFNLMAEHFNKMVSDCSIIPDILRWLVNTNIITSQNVIYRNKKTPSVGAAHNNLVWDAFGYTKATGINPVLGAKVETEDKKTLVVLDVLLSNTYTKTHLDAFVGRIQINRNSVTGDKRKTLPIIIYSDCSEHTLNTIKKLGIICFDISAIFGKNIFEILQKSKQLSLTFSHTENLNLEIENILNLMVKAGQDEALKELKGTLFEFLMYPLISSLYPAATISRGKVLSSLNENGEKESYEYDYIINSSFPPEIVIIELKGYHSNATIPLGDSNTKSSLKWFFRRTQPFAAKRFEAEINQGQSLKAVYITSANFWEDGKKFIQSLNKSKLKSVVLDTGYDRESLLELLRLRGFDKEKMIIERFYKKDYD